MGAGVSPLAGWRINSNKSIKTPQQLRKVIQKLSPKSPITDQFSRIWRSLPPDRGDQREQKRVWYKTQHEHWLGWLRGYSGPGGYNRADWDRSAEFVYNHIVNPKMLVYLAEGAGIWPILIEKAANAALANTRTMISMSSAIRKLIPWVVVESALLEKANQTK